MTNIRVTIAAVLVAGLMNSASAVADDTKQVSTWDSWHNIAIQYAYSWNADNDFILGYGSPAGDRHMVRFEFENIWKYGENYLYADYLMSSEPFGGVFGDDADNSEIYGLINSNLSLQKMLGLQRGLFDIALEGRAEFGTFFDYSAFAVGASLYFNMPGFVAKPGDKIQLTWWHRWNDDDFASAACFGFAPCLTGSEERYADHDILALTVRKEWDMFDMRWQHQTFLRVQLQEDGSNTEVQRFDRVFWEAEIFAYLTDTFSVGFRSEYFWDDGGIDFDSNFNSIKSDWRPQIAVKWDISRSD